MSSAPNTSDDLKSSINNIKEGGPSALAKLILPNNPINLTSGIYANDSLKRINDHLKDGYPVGEFVTLMTDMGIIPEGKSNINMMQSDIDPKQFIIDDIKMNNMPLVCDADAYDVDIESITKQLQEVPFDPDEIPMVDYPRKPVFVSPDEPEPRYTPTLNKHLWNLHGTKAPRTKLRKQRKKKNKAASKSRRKNR